MKVRELRAAIERMSAVHARLGSSETATALVQLSDALRSWDQKTVAALVKEASARHSDANA